MLFKNRKNPMRNISIRYSIFIYFTATALAAVLFIGISLYMRLSSQLAESITEENQGLLNQMNNSMDSYIRTTMRLSDSLYYGVIKNADISSDRIQSEITLLYDNNKENVDNIAVLSADGKLLLAVPAARLKSDFDITEEEWFKNTLMRAENIHFSIPHVQYIFDNSEYKYNWVISVSRAVEITDGGSTEQAVLLVDMGYGGIERILDSVSLGNDGYIYMIDSEGNIIYHPFKHLIDAGHKKENNIAAAGYRDGTLEENFDGNKRTVIVKTVGYTGWKLIGVTPAVGLALNGIKTKIFFVFVIAFILFIVALINSYISSRITDPIKELEKSVNELESGALDAKVHVGGSYEIEHLGNSVQKMAIQIQSLMDDIVTEHESKRRSEFDALQSQINPHFLYNTLDVIVWLIENGRQSDAVEAVTALARFFRISLSKGKSIISVRDEIEHVRNYLTIQHMRYKNKFSYDIEVSDDVLELSSLKLILQPLVENSIYHGMEFMDGDGVITIKAFRKDDDLYMSVADNGFGMTKERVDSLLSSALSVPSGKGSGIGVKNVNERIKLYFGSQYGLSIESEPDEGTVITIHLPAVLYSDMEKKEVS